MADVEEMLVDWAKIRFPAARPCTETPADLEDVLPAVRFVRVGGPRQYSLDLATVAVDCFGPDRTSAKKFAIDVEHALYYELPGVRLGDSGVTRVQTFSGPAWAPWDNTDIRRFTAAYRIFFRNA